MKKLLASTAIALVAVAGLSAPILAADDDSIDGFDEFVAVNQLAARGIDAVEVVKWGGRIRAEVQLADGSTVFQIFDPDTYALIGDSGNTRVLTEVDNGVAAPAGQLEVAQRRAEHQLLMIGNE